MNFFYPVSCCRSFNQRTVNIGWLESGLWCRIGITSMASIWASFDFMLWKNYGRAFSSYSKTFILFTHPASTFFSLSLQYLGNLLQMFWIKLTISVVLLMFQKSVSIVFFEFDFASRRSGLSFLFVQVLPQLPVSSAWF